MRRRYPMSDGEVHEKLAIPVLFLLIFISGIVSFYNFSLAIGLCLGAVSGFFIDPDLDQRDTTRAENRVYKISKILGLFFHAYWLPYSLLPHRSILTHGGRNKLTGWITMMFIATPLRMFYAHLWLLPVFSISTNLQEFVFGIPVLYWLGLWLSWSTLDNIHWLRDTWGLGNMVRRLINKGNGFK